MRTALQKSLLAAAISLTGLFGTQATFAQTASPASQSPTVAGDVGRQLNDLNSRMDRDRDALRSLNNQIATAQSSLPQLQKDIDIASATAAEQRKAVEASKSRIDAARAEINRLGGSVITQFQSRPEYQSAITALQSAQAQVDTTAAGVIVELGFTREYQDAESHLKAAQKRYYDLQAAKPSDPTAIAAADKDLTDAEDALNKLEVDAYRTSPEMAATSSALADSDRAMQALQAQLDQHLSIIPGVPAARERLNNEQALLETTGRGLDAAQAQLEKAQAAQKQTLDSIATAQARAQSTQNELDDLQKQFAAAQDTARNADPRTQSPPTYPPVGHRPAPRACRSARSHLPPRRRWLSRTRLHGPTRRLRPASSPGLSSPLLPRPRPHLHPRPRLLRPLHRLHARPSLLRRLLLRLPPPRMARPRLA